MQLIWFLAVYFAADSFARCKLNLTPKEKKKKKKNRGSGSVLFRPLTAESELFRELALV